MVRTLQLQIISPRGSVFSQPVARVEIPGSEGDFGVLPDHAPLLSLLRPGIITAHQKDGDARYFVTSGYAEVSSEGCLVLSDQIQDMASVTRASAETMRDTAKQDLANAKGEAARLEAEKKLAFAEELLKAAA
jgi:F-type H+-transporting ATPase subunit epsilon